MAHIGIVGENEYAEKSCKVDLTERLGYSRCRLSIAVPKSESYEGLEGLNDVCRQTAATDLDIRQQPDHRTRGCGENDRPAQHLERPIDQ